MKKKEVKKCGDCFYYEAFISPEFGECHCMPPVNDGSGNTTIDTGAIRRACGEFK